MQVVCIEKIYLLGLGVDHSTILFDGSIHVQEYNTRIQDLYFEFSAHIGAYIEAYNT